MANPRYNKQVTNRRGAMGGGMMKRSMYKKGTPNKKMGGKKKIDPKKQPGLAKLKKKRPDVVAKMGFFKKGGRA